MITSRQHGVVYLITFTPYGVQNIRNYNWERSDRLKFGSLFCLSKKNIGYPTLRTSLSSGHQPGNSERSNSALGKIQEQF